MNKEKIIAAFEKENGFIRHRLADVYGNCCAVGTLLKDAGYNMYRLMGMNSMVGVDLEYYSSSRTKEYWARKKLRETYGLTDDDIGYFICANDAIRNVTIQERKAKMVEWVKNLKENDE